MTAPLIRPFPLEAGRPENHGYVRCCRCGVWRPEIHVANSAEVSEAYIRWLEGNGEKPATDSFECIDRTWCAKQVLKETT